MEPKQPACSSQAVLDSLLQNLYDLGEREHETKPRRTRKQREGKEKGPRSIAAPAEDPAPLPSSHGRGQKKSTSSFFRELQEELHCVPAGVSTDFPPEPEPLATVSPLPRKSNRKLVEVVEFHSRRKRKLTPGHDENAETKTSVLEKDVDIQEFNLEKARLEVHRFGITGYGKRKERVLEQERAIMLGARPPKNSYINYKVLQEQIKDKKAAKEEERRMAQDTDIFRKKKRRGQEDRKSQKKKVAPSILSSGRAGQVGKFRNGTLILSPVDIKKITSSRVAK